MKLLDYIETYGFRKRWFADKLGISLHGLSNILHGKCFPSRELATKIVDITERRVSYEDLYLEKKSLEEYIERQNITKKYFANRIGVSPINFSRFFKKDHYPSHNTVKRIITETNGQIGFRELWEKD